MHKKLSGFLNLPTAIFLAGLMVAVALIYATGKDIIQPASPAQLGGPSQANVFDTLLAGSDYYVRGNPNAPVKIIEYSDLECPFCKKFQLTMQEVMSAYGDQVAWIYKHFPLDSIHSKARAEANAAECAGEQGGNKSFWDYLDRIFAITPSNNGLDLNELPKIAQSLNLNMQKFQQCLTSNKFASRIESHYQEGLEVGALGTPYSIVIAPNGQKGVINGAQDYSAVKKIIDTALKLK
ncbi:MAG: DSBA oxidoreductase [Parcubacteria group bacterium Gr01-1014_3]|nr:MAG: DSBA oxidoreductase [Parcubacteria group bacterium Gr01-1014_3]